MLLPEATSFFNVITIENNTADSLKGNLFINKPETWSIIGASSSRVSLGPGQKIYLPIRIGIPPNTLGGISFIVYAELRTADRDYSATSYITIERHSRWDMKALNTNVYLSDYRPVGDFRLKVENKGNANELIKLNFQIGDLLKFKTFIEGDSIMFLEIPAYTDTILHFEVFKRTDLSYAENRALIRNWRATSLYIEATTPENKSYTGMRVTPLESVIDNDLPLRNSPLNLDVTFFNLLSQQRPKASFKVHGKILFPENQHIQYSVGMYNLFFQGDYYQNFDFYQQMRYMLRYYDPKTSVWIGDRLGSGNLHTMTGSGVKAEHRINDRDKASMNIIYNPYGKTIGAFAGYDTRIGTVGLNSGITLESTAGGNNKYYTAHLGGAYRFFNRHTLRLQTATTLSSFKSGKYLQNDTATIGFAYRLNYAYTDRKLKFRIDNMNTNFTYLKNSGINRINSDFFYELNGRTRLMANYYRNSYLTNRFPYSFYAPSNRNVNETGRLILNYYQGNIIYQIGPQYNSTLRYYINSSSGLETTYKNYQPGLLSSVTFRLGNLRSITPTLAVNTMYFQYQTNEADREPYTVAGRWQYTAGLSYYDNAFRFNAYYTSGDATEVYRNVVVDDKPVNSQSLNIRPSYERYFFEDKIKIDAYLNYSYFMPSQRENTITSLQGSFFLNNGWTVYGNLNVFKNSRIDADVGRITTRDLNLMAGFRIAFDVQQPRIKYYDMAIVGFNDQDGNSVKDDDEKPISNVLINIKRDPKLNGDSKAIFAETKLITDPNGEIFYRNMPEGKYNLEITPLSNIEDLYFLEGRNQILEVDEDKIHYLPMVESYKVKGRIIVDRDPNSTEGRINLEGIRITAESENGSSYSALTDNNGVYVLNLPKANAYKVSIYNVFGERFILRQGSYQVQFMKNKSINLDFRFEEMRREIKFNKDSQLFDFNIKRD